MKFLSVIEKLILEFLKEIKFSKDTFYGLRKSFEKCHIQKVFFRNHVVNFTSNFCQCTYAHTKLPGSRERYAKMLPIEIPCLGNALPHFFAGRVPSPRIQGGVAVVVRSFGGPGIGNTARIAIAVLCTRIKSTHFKMFQTFRRNKVRFASFSWA